MSAAELPVEALYALAGALLLFFVWLLARPRQKIAATDQSDQLHRDEIIAAASSNDSRAISRALPIAAEVIKKNPQPVFADADFTAAICRLLFRGGQKLLCQQILTQTAERYSQQQWHLDLEIDFLTSQKQTDDKSLFRIQDLQRQFPENSKLNLYLANYNDKKKTYKQTSLQYFIKAAEAQPDNARWLYAVARCRQNHGDLAAALEAVNQLLKIDPGFPGAQDLKRLLEEHLFPKPPDPPKKAGNGSDEHGFAADRYSQVSEMGRGGMGIVYKAFDEVLQRWVAIKTLQDSIAESQPELKQRFLSEARILAALVHPSIPKVFDLSLKSPYYLAFELINGQSLRSFLEKQEKPLSLHHFLQMACDMASALAYACSKDVLHRDIKPDNILVDSDNHCYLIDFGLAQIEGQVNLTKTGLVMGTPWYLAPERFKGEPATVASEIYAFGVMLFEMLEGCKPYEGNDVNLVMVQEPKKVSREDVCKELQILISECLSKNPANRPANFDEILTIFENEMKKAAISKDLNHENSV